MKRSFVLLSFSILIAALQANAQNPESIEIVNENATATFRNFRWMTTQKLRSVEGSSFGEPVDPKPLDSKKLYRPGTDAYLYFDYTLTITESVEPDDVKTVYVSASGSGIGTRPVELKGESGTAFTGIVFGGFGGPSPRVDADMDLPLVVYGKRNNGKPLPSVKSSETIKLKISVDGVAMISESQFEAIKAMYRRLNDLESRLKKLESRQ